MKARKIVLILGALWLMAALACVVGFALSSYPFDECAAGLSPEQRRAVLNEVILHTCVRLGAVVTASVSVATVLSGLAIARWLVKRGHGDEDVGG